MWKCKECGGEIIAVGRVDELSYTINKNKEIDEIKYCETLEEAVDDEIVFESYYCNKCDREFSIREVIEDIAEWSDD